MIQIHGVHKRIGKAMRDGLLTTINIEIKKGTTQAHPDILRPKMENSIAAATKVDPMTIHTIKGMSNFLILMTERLLNFISNQD
jgi:hypothetical protein